MRRLLHHFIIKPYLFVKHCFRKPSLKTPDVFTADIVHDEIFRREIYRHDRFVIRSPGAVIMDVGANIGTFGIWAMKKFDAERVICFEASPVTFGYLVTNLLKAQRGTKAGELIPVNLAVSNKAPAYVTIFHRFDLSGASTMRQEGRDLGHGYRIRATTVSDEIDALDIEHVDLLKIDVEGHYLEVLQGIDDADFPRIRNIVIECDWVPQGAAPYQAVQALLEEKGYIVEADNAEKENNVMLYAYRREREDA